MISIERVLQILIYLTTLVGVAPLFLYLDLSSQGIFVLALITGIICDRSRHYWLSGLPATLLSFVFFFAYLLQISRVNLVLPVANLLVLLLAVRLASEKQGRHVLQIFVLATFALSASTLLSLSPFFFVYLVALVLLVTFGLVVLSFHGAEPGLILSRKQWRLLLSTGLLLPLGSLLLMLVFFTILPRTQHPLWTFLNAPARASIGFSDEVRPGSVAELSEVKQTALRVEVDQLPATQLYWRGVVLNRTDGRIWKRASEPPADRFTAENIAPVEQDIFIEVKADRFLPALDPGERIGGIRTERTADGVFMARNKLRKQRQYQVTSFPGGGLSIVDSHRREFYLQVPENLSTRLIEVAREIRRAGDETEKKITALEQYFLDRNLRYSSSDLPPTTTPVETFLFESQRGYCEYFASSFALLLRLSGVPARLVGGYLGGEYNELGGYYLVGEELAHVWVEALDDDGQWQRIDPSRFAVNAGEELGTRGLSERFSFRILFDTVDYYWTRLVISYDFSSQFRMLRDAGRQLKAVGRFDFTQSWKVAIGLLIPVLLCWLLLQLSKRPGRRERLLRNYLLQVEKRFGIKGQGWEAGLFNLALLTGEPLCREFAEYYGRIIYRDKTLSSQDYRYLQRIIRQLAES